MNYLYSKEKYIKILVNLLKDYQFLILEVQKNSYDEFLKSKKLKRLNEELSKGIEKFLKVFSQLKTVQKNLP